MNAQVGWTGRTSVRIAVLTACAVGLAACGASLNSPPGDQKASVGGSDMAAPKSSGAVDAAASKTTAAERAAFKPDASAPTPVTTGAVNALTAVATPGSNAYLIGTQDVLDISVFKVPELTKSVQVADTGTINLPLLSEVPAAGKTAQQLERDLTSKLASKYLQNPQVTVAVREFNSQRVTLDGAVKKPGVYPVRGKLSLLQAISLAEGLDPSADSTVVVFREVDGKRSAAKFDVAEIRSGSQLDPELKAGDLVVAPTSFMKESFNNVIKVLPLAGVFALVL